MFKPTRSLARLLLGFAFCVSQLAPGTSAIAGSQVSRAAAQRGESGQYSVIYAFGGPPGDGANPEGGVIVDKAGRIFGTTHGGGNVSDGNGGYDGTLFELTPSGSTYSETFLYSMSCTITGCNPFARPFQDRRGNLYATNSVSEIGQNDFGSAVEFNPSGSTFALGSVGLLTSADGIYPEVGFTEIASTLYTAVSSGGSSAYGTLVAFSRNLQPTVVHNFGAGNNDGKYPASTPVAGPDGVLYGSTEEGGLTDSGTVYAFVPSRSGGVETILWSFQQGGGSEPAGGLVLDSTGSIYGTTYGGGRYGNGVVYKLSQTSDGYAETVLHAFSDGADGAFPTGSMVLKGNYLYGVTANGGLGNCYRGCGTIYKVSTSGTGYAVVHTFLGTDGVFPEGGLVFQNGAFFGTTADGPAYGGGEYGNGLVFKFVP
jgi:uncharacterized repeat protein (TIGR03803 family)